MTAALLEIITDYSGGRTEISRTRVTSDPHDRPQSSTNLSPAYLLVATRAPPRWMRSARYRVKSATDSLLRGIGRTGYGVRLITALHGAKRPGGLHLGNRHVSMQVPCRSTTATGEIDHQPRHVSPASHERVPTTAAGNSIAEARIMQRQ